MPRYVRIPGQTTQTSSTRGAASLHTVTYRLEDGGKAVMTSITLAKSGKRIKRLEVTNSKGQTVHWRREIWGKGRGSFPELLAVSAYDLAFLDLDLEGNHKTWAPFRLITQRSQHDNHSYVREKAGHVFRAEEILRDRFWNDTHSKINKSATTITSPSLPGFEGPLTILPADKNQI